jgi:hypothetical protein
MMPMLERTAREQIASTLERLKAALEAGESDLTG